jgi:exodeoxyribonuclease-1
MAYVFYDVETTGKSTAYDQILQFAAIFTGDDLSIVETFNVRCRLLSHVVPSPEALLITGVGVADLTSARASHFEMMRQIHTKLHEWSAEGAVFIGWNSMRFDEAMLRQAYYQTLLPIYQTNTNGNGRADMMRMAQVASACFPNSLSIPLDASGKRIFKLGRLAKANGITLDNAHEAMADTSVVLEIAKLIKRQAPAFWDAMIANARKAAPLNLLKRNSSLLLSETYGGVPYNLIVSPIVVNSTNANEWATFDLQFDPIPLLNADDAILRAAIDGKIKQIRRVSINAQPSLLPLDFVPDNIRGGRLSLNIYQARAQAIGEHAGFRQRVARLLSDRYADRAPSVYVEEKIYAGFPASTDEARMHDFHERCWSERPDIVEALEDGRFRELGKRVVATERPDLLSDQQSGRWQAWRRDRLLADGDVPWSTIATARAQIAELKQDSSSEQRQQLDEIERFLVNMVA